MAQTRYDKPLTRRRISLDSHVQPASEEIHIAGKSPLCWGRERRKHTEIFLLAGQSRRSLTIAIAQDPGPWRPVSRETQNP